MQKRILTCIALTSLMTALASDESPPAEFSRKGLWEVYGFAQAGAIINIFESNAGIFGGGLGAGYNISQHFTLNGDLAISYVDWGSGLSRFWDDETSSTLFMGHISADWNILKSRVTPLLNVSLGVGALSNGSGLALDQTIGAGVRWDVNEQWLVKAIIRGGAMETTSSPNIDVPDFWTNLGFSLAVGYKF